MGGQKDRIVSGSLNQTGILGNLAGGLSGGSSNVSFPTGTSGLLLGGGQDNRGSGTSFAALLKLYKRIMKQRTSTPSLLTTDNNEASISIGDNIPFVTGSFTVVVTLLIHFKRLNAAMLVLIYQ